MEANEHYLSDVLAGYALGHFICTVVNDTFMGSGDHRHFQVNIAPSKEGILLGVGWTY